MFHAVKRIAVAGVVAGVTVSLLTAVPASAQEYGNYVDAGRRLVAGDRMTSNGGGYTLTVQTDGNVVERRGATAVWATNTAGNPGAVFDVQTDGNLVVRSNAGRALWTSGTPGHSGAHLSLDGSGELAAYPAAGSSYWSNHVGVVVTPRRTTLYTGQSLRSDGTDQRLSSPDGRFEFEPTSDGVDASEFVDDYGTGIWFRDDGRGGGQEFPGVLTMQTDGNLVLRGTNGVAYWSTGTTGAGNRFTIQDDGNFVVRRANGSAAWASGTTSLLLGPGETAGPGRRFVDVRLSYEPAEVTVVQPDGNVVRYGAGNRVVWTSHTSGNPGAKLILQTDGNLVVRRPDGRAVWQSGTSRCGAHVVLDLLRGALVEETRFEDVWSMFGSTGHTC